MVSLLEDHLIDDVVSRAEQSRVSYNIQTEEFRNLNANLQTYLSDIKTIDDDNRQLQENIEEIRTNYILSLENHLKRLPNDFRQQSQTLTEAHIERYRSKSRARRFGSEREELKRRIHFVASNEKEQTKRLNILQNQERAVRNEFNKLNDHMQRLLNYVESEKQNYQQAMTKVDNLQVQFEQISVERSKTEFEIQTLREEVKLMQTAREFLDEERETIIATQTEANEYLLSRLNESINRIREDFTELNQNQLKQVENEHKQMLKILEESFIANETIDETTTHQRTIQADHERLQDEHQSAVQELTTLQDHNQTLSERVVAMEADLYSLSDERMQELTSKDNELERSKIELQTLNEKLNHLAEYDRNLKFELTLYRGVLESEYRRKEQLQQKQSSISIPHLIRPTTLRSNNNSMTDRTVWLTSSTNANKLNDQQQEEILSTRTRVPSEYDPIGEDINDQNDDVITRKTTSSNEKLKSGEILWQQLIEPFGWEAQNDTISNTNISQNAEKHSNSPSSTVPEEDQATSIFEVQQPSSRTSSTTAPTQKSPTSVTTPILREDQSASSQTQRSPATPPELQSLPTRIPSTQTIPPATAVPVSFDVHQSSSPSPQENQILFELQQASSRTSSVGSAAPSDMQRRPSTINISKVLEHQPSSRTSSVGSAVSSDIQRSSVSDKTSTILEHQPPVLTSSVDPAVPSDILRSSTSATNPTVLEHQSSSRTSSVGSAVSSDILRSSASAIPEQQPQTSDVPLPSSTPSQEHEQSSRTSSISSAVPSDIQRRPSSANTSTVPEYQPSSRTSSVGSAVPYDTQRSSVSVTTPAIPEYQPSTSPQEYQSSSRTSSVGSAVPPDIQRRPSSANTSTVPEYQPSSRTSSVGSAVPSNIQRSSGSATGSTVLEDQQPTSDVRQSSSTSPEEHHPSSRTSSIVSAVSSDIQRTSASAIPEQQPQTSDVPQPSSTPSQEHEQSSRTSSISSAVPSNIQRRPSAANTSTSPQEYQPSSRTSSVGSAVPYDTQRSSVSVATSAIPEYQPSTSDVWQSPSIPPQEYQSSSRTSSVGSAASSDIQRRPSTATTSTVLEDQPSISDVQQSPATPSEEHQSLSRTSSVGSAISSTIHRPRTSATASIIQEDQSSTSDARQSPATAPSNIETSSEVKSSPTIDASTRSADVQEKTSPVAADDYQTAIATSEFGDESQLSKSFGDTNDKIEHEESTPHINDERATIEADHSERHPSIHSIGASSTEQYEVSFDIERDGSRSSSFALTNTPQRERKQNLSQLDTDISSVQDDKSQLQQNEFPDGTKREEEIDSSLANKTEEINLTDSSSSPIINDDQHDDNLYEYNPFSLPHTSKQSSNNSSLTDIEEVDASTSQKFETRSDDNDDPNLAIIMQDLRYVFHELANNEDLVEINNDLPDKLLDRLEFRDHIIRTLFDSLLRKYLVQAAAQGNRSTTLDWVEFRDILFPFISGRYTEQHIRKLFDFLDTSRDGYLSLQEIAELLEVLQASDTIDLAQSIIDEYDTDHDGKLNVDEFIEAIKNQDNINEHVLSKETENQQWFNNPSPTENQTITLEVPIINFPSRTGDKFSQGISLLGRIFKKVGARSETKQLDSNNKNLSMQITNEFISNNINISSDDLQFFIQLFLNKKQNTDPLINWIEFRDIFLPIVNNGFYSKNDIKQWFDILDTNHNGIITREQTIQLLHLLQIQNPEETFDKLNETHADNTASWTLDDLTSALDNVDETATHLLTNNEQISSFDIDWLSNNVF